MKKYLFLAAIAAAFLSCSKKDEPANVQQHQVTFTLPELQVEQQPMQAPMANPLVDDDNTALTDLYMFDGTTLLAHQTSDQDDFGTITVMLMAGEHNLHFVATRSTGLSYDAGVLSMTTVRPTYGAHLVLNVTGSSDQNITLNRVTGQFKLTIEDEIPSTAAKLRIALADYYKGLNVATFAGTTNDGYSVDINITSKVGTSGANWTLNHLAPVYGTQYETTYTITVFNASDEKIAEATGTVPLNSNTKTLLHGDLFTGTRALFVLSTTWNDDLDVDM
ncbi:MAG: hypothetical protein K6F10_02615 [Paludibacteraceae bacterium]|nr:hypothetical protein [Paludibacteraceae bacterium]